MYYMDRYELSESFARMLRKSRNYSGKSQDFVARSLGVSKKIVQNWEDGTSRPNHIKGLEWFDVLGQQPLPYYLEALYPNEFCDISACNSDEEIEKALITYIKGTSADQKRKLLFILFGDHGSSPYGVIEIVTAHLHCNLRSRLNIAQNIINNYEVEESKGELVAEKHVKPNMETLKKSFENAKSAVKRSENSYSN